MCTVFALLALAPAVALFVVLRVDRTMLAVEQRRGVDVALSGYPVLNEGNRQALRKIVQQ